MNTEDKQKAMLAHDLTGYVKDKHTQDECMGFIDGYNAALTKFKFLGIKNVVWQRELLLAFTSQLNRTDITQIEIAEYELVVDAFLKNL